MIPLRCSAAAPSLRLSMRAALTSRPRGPCLAGGVGAWRRRAVGPAVFRAWESTAVTEEKESGHFSVKANQSLLFFDNLFPIKLSAILRLPSETDRDLAGLLRRFDSSSLGILDPIRLVKRAIPDELPLRVLEIVPRLKDGGAFVKIEYEAGVDPAEIEGSLLRKLEQRPLKPWFSPFRGIKARLVRGTPWLEDLYRFPSPVVRAEFVAAGAGEAAELSEETLYGLFRRFGKIADIVPQAWDSKETPRHARIAFPRIRDAIMARNCLHGFVVPEAMGGGRGGTVLRLAYVKRVKAHSIWNWLTSHPRIVVPVAAALLAGFSVIVFDPIRKFFVRAHVQHSLRFTESRLYQWFKSRAGGLSLGRKTERLEGLGAVWNHRRDLIGKLQGWLDGSSDTFIVVTGPRGSGKREMVLDQALAGRGNVLVVDCRPIADASGEAGTIKRLGGAVGYRPIFSWANSVSSMIDLAVQSTTGVKAGFSENLEAQVGKILHTTAAALKEVALAGRSSRDKDAALSEDAFLDAHPERRPVVVIDNFLHRNEDKALVYDRLADWAASLVQNKVAHVVFLTSESAYAKPLSRAMPDRVFRALSLDDLSHDVAKNGGAAPTWPAWTPASRRWAAG
ncbi:hypothetical protein CDD83_4838 [Cordyceps sp. RAO-2017]|nr:hypothetical protein CDD83_4838 [Cordyceps sp. RAO-2017]